jgi:hypothetical protein
MYNDGRVRVFNVQETSHNHTLNLKGKGLVIQTTKGGGGGGVR